MAIVGLWGSFFSRSGGKAMTKPFRRFWSSVEVRIGEPIPPSDVTTNLLAEKVASLGGWDPPETETHNPD